MRIIGHGNARDGWKYSDSEDQRVGKVWQD